MVVHAAAHQRARRRDQAGAVAPGQPHLLAGGVEGDGQPGEHPVAGAERRVAQEDARLGVHERGGAAVCHGHALGGAGGARGEDDPRVVVRFGRGRGRPAGVAQVDPQSLADHRAHVGLAEHEPGPLLRVVHVDRNVGGSGGERSQDRYIEVRASRGDADTDAVAASYARLAESFGQIGDLREQAEVIQLADTVVQGRGIRVPRDRLFEDREQRAGGRRGGPGAVARGAGEQLMRHGCGLGPWRSTVAGWMRSTDQPNRPVPHGTI
jgi:hypothetical protein